MKSWLAKFKISTGLDAGATPDHSSQATGGPEELKRFELSMRSLDRQLRAPQPAAEIPTGLHGSIMGAVIGASRSPEQRTLATVLRWLPAPALALIVVYGFWVFSNEPAPSSPPFSGVGVALDESHKLTQRAPGAVLAPLSEEMDLLSRDLRDAVEHLVASVP